MFWTGSKGLSNCWISRRHLQSLPHIRMCFGLHSMEGDIKHRATTCWWCRMTRVGVTVSQHPEQYLPEGIHTDSGCNSEAIADRNKVSWALDEWTSTNTVAITTVIAYYLDQNWVLCEVQLAFNEVDSPFFSYFDISLRITGQGSTYGSTASRTFQGSCWSIWTEWWPFRWNYNW